MSILYQPPAPDNGTSVDEQERAKQLRDRLQNSNPRSSELASFNFGNSNSVKNLGVAEAAAIVDAEVRSRAPAEIPGISDAEVSRQIELIKYSMVGRDGAERRAFEEARKPARQQAPAQMVAEGIPIDLINADGVQVEQPLGVPQPLAIGQPLGNANVLGQPLASSIRQPLFQLDPGRNLNSYAFGRNSRQLDSFRREAAELQTQGLLLKA